MKKKSQQMTEQQLLTIMSSYYQQMSNIKRVLYSHQELKIDDNAFINLAIVDEATCRQKERDALENANEKDLNEGRLSSYEDLYTPSQVSTSPDEIFDKKPADESDIRRILVVGRAGIGKSTLCQYMVYKWSIGHLWKERSYKAVFWIKLRQLTNLSSGIKNLYDLIHQQCIPRSSHTPKTKEAIENFLDNFKEESLFILDGYDEVSYLLDQKSVARELLEDLVAQSNVLITSRPQATYDLTNIDRRLEVLGFTNENIPQFVKTFFQQKNKPEQIEPLLNVMRNNPSIWGVAHVPINLELICTAWLEDQLQKDQQTLTITRLYQLLQHFLCITYLNKKNNDEGFCSKKLLLRDMLKVEKLCANELDWLSRLAIRAQNENKLILSYSDLEEEYNKVFTGQTLGEDLPTLVGSLHFIKPIIDLDGLPQPTGYYFIHLTFQEYFAGRYMSKALLDPKDDFDATRFVKEKKYHSSYELVWWFTVGFLSSKQNSSNELNKFFNLLYSEPLDILGLRQATILAHCLEESSKNSPKQRVEIINKLKSLTKILLGYEKTNASFDLASAGLSFIKTLQMCPQVVGEMKLVEELLDNLKTGNTLIEGQLAGTALGYLARNTTNTGAILLETFNKTSSNTVKRSILTTLSYLDLDSAVSEFLIKFLTEYSEDKDNYLCHAASSLSKIAKTNKTVCQQLKEEYVKACSQDNTTATKVVLALSLGWVANLEQPPSVSQILAEAFTTACKKEKFTYLNAAILELVSSSKMPEKYSEVISSIIKVFEKISSKNNNESQYKKLERRLISTLGKLSTIQNVQETLLRHLGGECEWARLKAATALGWASNKEVKIKNALLQAFKKEKNKESKLMMATSAAWLSANDDSIVKYLIEVISGDEKRLAKAKAIDALSLIPFSDDSHRFQVLNDAYAHALADTSNQSKLVEHNAAISLVRTRKKSLKKAAIASSLFGATQPFESSFIVTQSITLITGLDWGILMTFLQDSIKDGDLNKSLLQLLFYKAIISNVAVAFNYESKKLCFFQREKLLEVDFSEVINQDVLGYSAINLIRSIQTKLINFNPFLENVPGGPTVLPIEIKYFSVLMKWGIDVNNEANHLDWTALHQASYERNTIAISRLLSDTDSASIMHQEKANALDKNGNTPLHLLLSRSFIDKTFPLDAIRLLRSKGADYFTANSKKITPLHLALLYGQQEVVELFCQQSNQRRILANISQFMRDIRYFELAHLKQRLSDCIESYKKSDISTSHVVLNQFVCGLLGIKTISYDQFHYLALLRSRGGMITKTENAFREVHRPKTGQTIVDQMVGDLEGYILEGWNVGDFLATRIQFFIQILMELECDKLNEYDKPERIPLETSKELLYKQIHSAIRTFKMYVINIQLNVLKDQKYKEIFKDSYIRILAQVIGLLGEGEQLCYPTGYALSTASSQSEDTRGHTLYAGFKRTTQGEHISIRIDNLLLKDMQDNNLRPRPYQREKKGVRENVEKYPPYLVKVVQIEEFRDQDPLVLQYLNQILEAYWLDRSDALPKLYSYPQRTAAMNQTSKMIAETDQWLIQKQQTVGNCVVKNYNLGLLFGFFKNTVSVDTDRQLYRWLLEQEKKRLMEKVSTKFSLN